MDASNFEHIRFLAKVRRIEATHLTADDTQLKAVN